MELPLRTPCPADGDGAANGIKKSHGTRKWFALGALVSLLLLLGLFSRTGPSNRDITLAFVGFSNYVAHYLSTSNELRAYLWFTNGPRPSLCWITSVCRRIGNEWVDDGGTARFIHQRVPDTDKFPSLDPPNEAQLISIKVHEPKLPLRVVVLVQERSSGLAGMKEALQQWNYDHFQRKSRYVAGGRRYSVTNEFWAEPNWNR